MARKYLRTFPNSPKFFTRHSLLANHSLKIPFQMIIVDFSYTDADEFPPLSFQPILIPHPQSSFLM
jgi:hypothetical protein